MTRRDFELIAAVLRESRLRDSRWDAETPTEQWEATAHRMASALGAAYPNFDAGRFMAAVHLGQQADVAQAMASAIHATASQQPTASEIVALRVENGQLRALLASIEWVHQSNNWAAQCPVCLNYVTEDHRANCELNAIINNV